MSRRLFSRVKEWAQLYSCSKGRRKADVTPSENNIARAKHKSVRVSLLNIAWGYHQPSLSCENVQHVLGKTSKLKKGGNLYFFNEVFVFGGRNGGQSKEQVLSSR